ncbi:hypothetical protein F5Y09DRAFT_264555 [Xylaria sp. FL1042]|nr:hypothetical protein F5Y09DRAFT_264555 [Xylaria sp. FL1042]
MGLLTALHDESLGFTEDLSEDIPPYAIRSHTWGHDNQEVTFKDILGGTGQQKQGYRKIEFCYKQATFDGLYHMWVDTYCIDALDECDEDENITLIIRLLSQANSPKSQSPLLRIFLISRPELPIRLGFASVQSTYHDSHIMI